MDTIRVKVNYIGEITINGEHTADAPLEMIWFPDNDLIIETQFEKILVNSRENVTITPKVADKNLQPIKDIDIKLLQNNVAKYLIINNKLAYKLPSNILDIV